MVLLTCAFASVVRHGRSRVSRLWLIAWILVVLHFSARLFLFAPGILGTLAASAGAIALVDAGVLFSYAAVPYRHAISSIWMTGSLLAVDTLYVALITLLPGTGWILTAAALLLGVVPFLIALLMTDTLRHPLRWRVVSLYGVLSLYLLLVQHRQTVGPVLALDGLLFAVYFGCGLHIWSTYRRATAGAFITIAGFLGWALVFVVPPMLRVQYPGLTLENDVWNLPKYVVAVGMILLILEDQLEHNKYLALHDELTGLANRRLFLDRLSLAIERARRFGGKIALLVVDLDRFKMVNDTMGHHAGDRLLQQVANIFSSRVRASDTVARTGGDEFSVILENSSDPASVQQVAVTLLQQLNAPLKVEGQPVNVGASVGIALFPDDAADAESLRIAADLRMYSDKKMHREGSATPAVTFPSEDENSTLLRSGREQLAGATQRTRS